MTQPTRSPGKMRGLQTTANPAGVFTILALDHASSLANTMRPAQPQTVTYTELSALKREMLHSLAPSASAVLIDPVYGLAPAIFDGAVPGQVGILLAVEDGDYAYVQKKARLFAGWSVAQAKRAGANAIKCFFYYHPDDTAVAAHQEQFVRQVAADCRAHDIALFAEPLSYDMTAATRQYVVVETARRISRLGIDVLKLEFPIDIDTEPAEEKWREACAAVSAACVTPWAILSAGVDFAAFARQVTIACQSGASGYLVGRAVWKDGVGLPPAARQTFWQTTARDRLQKLAAIASELARPWTDFYAAPTALPPIGWHQSI